jgi:hypothetical protein
LYYTKGKTIELPNLREDFEVHLVHNVALGLQARQLNETTSVARLRKKSACKQLKVSAGCCSEAIVDQSDTYYIGALLI